MLLAKRLLLVLFVVALALPATAGEWAHDRDGFYLGFNAGLGSAKVKPDAGDEDDGGGGAGSFRLGWGFANQFLVGLESTGWVGDTDLNADLTLSTYKLNFTWYPGAKGWFVRTGLGAGSAELTGEVLGFDVSIEESGGGFGFGGGHEWRLTRKFALGVAADWDMIDLDEEKFEYLNFTAQFNWYF